MSAAFAWLSRAVGCGGAWLLGVWLGGRQRFQRRCAVRSEGRPQALTPTACVCACRLGHNSIGDAGATKLGEALQQNSTLTTLM